MLIGYARVSTLDQNPQLQIEALNEAGVKRYLRKKYQGQVQNDFSWRMHFIICVKAIR